MTKPETTKQPNTALAHRVVLTIGGNALIRPDEIGSVKEQWKRAIGLAKTIAKMPPTVQLVITHGNGPQVGRVLLRSDLCANEIPPIPVDLAVANTQGEIGLMLQQAIHSMGKRLAIAVLTQVIVNKDDVGFINPTKFIGSYYSEEEAKRRAASLGWSVKEDSGLGWRRVVPSPEPLEIVEQRAIEALLVQGFTVIACGGGGVPVIRKGDRLRGVEAVVDKDRSSALLAHKIGANSLICLTAVDEVMLDFGKPTMRPLRELSMDDARRYLEDGQFPEGSMGPKVRSALKFLNDGGGEVLITSPELLEEALKGKRGTRIVRDNGEAT
jgi:carbamate kinase